MSERRGEQPRRALLVHSDRATRETVAAALRSVSEDRWALFEADSIADAVGKARWVEPELVLLDLVHELDLALDSVPDLGGEGSGAVVLGLFDPHLVPAPEGEFYRRAARAGVGDFLALPLHDAELAEALGRHQPDVGAAEQSHGRITAFFGAKGGVGTTTVSANVGLVMAGSGQVGEVALVDGRLQFGTAASVLGLEPAKDLGDLVADGARGDVLTAYLTAHPATGLQVLAAPVSLGSAESVSPEDLSQVLLRLRRRFDHTVVDLPSQLDQLSLAVLDLAERCYVVTDPTTPAVLATARALAGLEELGVAAERSPLVLNRVGVGEGALPRRTVELELRRRVIAELPFHKNVVRATNSGSAVVVDRQRNPFAVAIGELADDVVAERTAAVGAALT